MSEHIDRHKRGWLCTSGAPPEKQKAPGALQLRPTDTWAYYVTDISHAHDVGVSGGSIIGDRNVHDFKVNGEEGHCICIEDESERVAIDRVRLSKAIGDGVLLVAQGEEGSSCKDISITHSEFFDNRRQSISIVGGMRVLIENNEIHHINGTAPQFGIDIESLKYKSRDITIRLQNHQRRDVFGDGTELISSGSYV